MKTYSGVMHTGSIPAEILEPDKEPELIYVSCESFGHEGIGVHIRPYEDEVITITFREEDVWKFIQQMSLMASASELSD